MWLDIQDANSRAETFSQITRAAFAIVPADVDCPSTDKGSIQRARVYKEFNHLVDSVYQKLEPSSEGYLALSIPDLEAWIAEKLQVNFGISMPSMTAEFFNHGVDSSIAIYFRSVIIREISLGGNGSSLSPMVVFEHGSAHALSKALYDMRVGQEVERVCAVEEMSALIRKY